jgi:transglutaminase-like putative cysteine protease
LTSVLVVVIASVLKALVMAVVYAMPVLGVWAASSLAAYLNGPPWAPFVAGALAFPVLPVAWEVIFEIRRARKRAAKPHILTLADRLTLRTLAVNFAFLAALLVFYPSHLFEALSARGDWFVAGKTDRTSEALRAGAFKLADRFEWLYELTHENPFEDEVPPPPPPSPPGPSGAPSPGVTATSTPKPSPVPVVTSTPTAQPAPTVPAPAPTSNGTDGDSTGGVAPAPQEKWTWPLDGTLHPLVQALPSAAEASPQTVGACFRERVSDPIERLKAVHDYVADRVAYDRENLDAGGYRSQDAATVFASRRAVCAGYSQLMVAIGKAAGLEVVYVVGYSRDMGGDISGTAHAWNAARVGGNWYLIDVTWDAGYVNDGRFTKEYSSEYLLTPPEVFGINHLPDEPRWQLRERPISRGEFIRQPNLRPRFYSSGLSLRAPERSQVSVNGPFVLEVENPRSVSLIGRYGYKGLPVSERCDVELDSVTRVLCPVRAGEYHVRIFVGERAFGVHSFVGQFEVNRR